jgi:hypothetical protein
MVLKLNETYVGESCDCITLQILKNQTDAYKSNNAKEHEKIKT